VRPPRLVLVALAFAGATAACTAGSPCRTADFRKTRGFSQPYAGHWVVARGDTLTLPEMGDRFRLSDVVLDTDTVVVGAARSRRCHLRGHLVFTVPKAETLAVSWFGAPEHVTIFGWPAELGPFAGISASWWGGDSLHGAILFDERLGVQMRPGITAQFWAGRR
jgi:hypothetical protein